MRKIGLALATVAALATTAVVNSPAEARGGRNAAIGFGVAAGVLGAAAAANAYNNGYYYGPRYGYYGGEPHHWRALLARPHLQPAAGLWRAAWTAAFPKACRSSGRIQSIERKYAGVRCATLAASRARHLALARQRGNEALEQCDELFSGQSDSG